MNKNKTLLIYMMLIICFYLIGFVPFKSSDHEYWGWVLIFLFAIYPTFNLCYFLAVMANITLKYTDKLLIFFLNIIMYILGTCYMWGTFEFGSLSNWMIVLIPSIIGSVVGIIAYRNKTNNLV